MLWACLCLLALQASAVPHVYQENVRGNRHNPIPAFPTDEPVYPPAPLPEAQSLLALREGMGGGVGMGMEQIPSFDPMIPGYIPTSTPFDNPSSNLATPINTIPSFAECSVRPQTVLEIQRMRETASRIATMMQQETLVMNKRKDYLERMTLYLNDRIREVNQVKTQLNQETQWIDLSSNRIAELEEREKLVKLQDIQACLSEQTTRSMADGSAVAQSLADIQRQASSVQSSISAIQARMNSIGGSSTGS